jgi:RNA polymerase sigma factor (sigma-70 family)
VHTSTSTIERRRRILNEHGYCDFRDLATELFNTHHGEVRRRVESQCPPNWIDDVISDLWVAVATGIETIRFEEGGDPLDRAVRWLWRVLKNKKAELQKRLGRRSGFEEPIEAHPKNKFHAPDEGSDAEFWEVSLEIQQQALASLKLKRRMIIEYKHLDGLSYREIAQTELFSGKPENSRKLETSLKSMAHTAREQLADRMLKLVRAELKAGNLAPKMESALYLLEQTLRRKHG